MDDLKFDPEFSSTCPMNALHFIITNHYLLERDCDYITSGARNVSHQTNIHNFQIKMGWRKAYSRLGLWLRPEFKLPLILKFGKFSNFIKKFSPLTSIGHNLEAIDLLWQISRACEKKYPDNLKEG